jgi:glycosyltransferase involved in cell wall biosynthesis
VVSTAVMGTADVLRGVKGAVVAPDRLDGFAATVVSVLKDTARQGELSKAGPRDAEAWSAQAMAVRLADLYRDVVADKRP